MKKEIAVISTDWHLKESNIEQIKDLVRQKCELAKSLGIKVLFCLGDMLDSRPGQKEVVLTALSDIINMVCTQYEFDFWVIPGNHDKQNYSSYDSYLNSYKFHPKFKVIDRKGMYSVGDVLFHMMPFFKEDMWFKELEDFKEYIGEFDKSKRYVLLSHQAINGSVNNDGSKVQCGISVNDFKGFNLVLLGHYHNAQQLSKNIFHIPSIQQNNFGEDPEKGFTVVYDDCSIDLVKAKFKEYEKIVIDMDKHNSDYVDEQIVKYSNTNKYVRFEFIGSEDRVKFIKKEKFIAAGIDVKIKVKEIEKEIEYVSSEIKKHDKDTIVEEFKEFCNENKKDFNEGVKFLNKKLNGK